MNRGGHAGARRETTLGHATAPPASWRAQTPRRTRGYYIIAAGRVRHRGSVREWRECPDKRAPSATNLVGDLGCEIRVLALDALAPVVADESAYLDRHPEFRNDGLDRLGDGLVGIDDVGLLH